MAFWPWIFWHDNVLIRGFKEVSSLCKMSISYKNTFSVNFGSILGVLDLRSIFLAGPFSQGITAWTLQFNSVWKRRPRGVKGLHLKYILPKNLFFGAFRLLFESPTAPDILSLDSLFKVISPWIFWRGKVLIWGFKEVRSLRKMWISL